MLRRMNVVFASSVLGVVLHVTALRVPQKATVLVRPPGSNIFLGDSVHLQCTVDSCGTFTQKYQWYRSNPQALPNPRHLVSGDSYFITTVMREDGDTYWCQAGCQDNRTGFVVRSQPVSLSVSELLPPSLRLTPNTRQMFRGERFTLLCPTSGTNSSGWNLMHFSPEHPIGTTNTSVHSLPPGGRVVSVDESGASELTAARGTSGLYWCEGAEGRSAAVCITVSYGGIILRSPSSPVFPGDDVTLYCQYKLGNRMKTRFLKNGTEIDAKSSSSSGRVSQMTLTNVTEEDEGFYSCASHDGKLQSPKGWLSVRPDRGNFRSEETPISSNDSWKWILVSFGVVIVFLSLTVCLRYQKCFTQGSWPAFKQEVPPEVLPATKQDATEVQWDLSWMEMSNLLDKDTLYSGS